MITVSYRIDYMKLIHSIKEVSVDQNDLATQLSDALKNNQMYLVYQPIFDCSEFIVGYEVLMRWTHPEKGEISPYQFIMAFDDSELISKLTEWFFDRLVSEMKQVGLLKVKKIFINLSFRQLEDPSLQTIIDNHQDSIDFNKVVFEITEKTLMNDISGAMKIMEDLTTKGISFALDDFGTGFTSMQYLKVLPLSYIKVDKGFVGEIDINHSDMTLVKASIEMSKAMGFSVIAEGVENKSQFVLLKSMGVDYVQGYLFDRPTMKDELS